MTEPTITCPNCHTVIRLTESLAGPLIAATRLKFEQQISQKDEEIAARELLVREGEKQVVEARRAIDAQISERVEVQLRSERDQIASEESRKARLTAAADLDASARQVTELKEVLAARDAKLAQAQNAQAELIKKQRELDDAKRELELTVETRIQSGLAEVRLAAKREAEDGLKFKVMEKDHTIASMQQIIEELKKRAEQGSQQLQGEVQELELEGLLRVKFPFDSIEPVAKGEFGGDVLQRIISQAGNPSGAILWESKRTKNWSDGWLVKLREDQRAAKADVSVLVTHALPKGIGDFDIVDGVWVTSPRAALPVATILRYSLVQVHAARQVADGQQSKTEMVYEYLTGPRFRHRVEAIVEAFSSMTADLDKERKVMTRQWAKRELQIERVMGATVGMYGDLQGIAGKTLQEIEGLSFEALAGPTDEI